MTVPTWTTPSGYIQWKGTDVCMNINCACGTRSHIDGDFVYYVRCPGCRRVWRVGDTVPLFPLGDGERAENVKEAAE